MGFDTVRFAVISPLFGAYYAVPFELKMLVLGAVIAVGIFWWLRKQSDNR